MTFGSCDGAPRAREGGAHARADPPAWTRWTAAGDGRVGDAPRDLTLLDETGRAYHGVGTPPSGSVDYLLTQMTMTPGSWTFTAGYEGVSPTFLLTFEPGNLPPLDTGRLVARFDVTPDLNPPSGVGVGRRQAFACRGPARQLAGRRGAPRP